MVHLKNTNIFKSINSTMSSEQLAWPKAQYLKQLVGLMENWPNYMK